MKRTILHCDLNNFYASVEAILDPTLKGKAIAVCGDPNKRHGIVLAKSDLAKKAGVKTGDAIWQAKLKCPELVVVATNHGDYSTYAKKVRDIYYRYTDLVEPFGADEAWLDVTASCKLFGKDGKQFADEIRRVVREELGLTVSVGVSFSKVYAKIGSDYKKPDATTVISPENAADIVYPLPVIEMIYIGRKTVKLFEKLSIKTIGDLANFDVALLREHIGVNADTAIRAARGEDDDPVTVFGYRSERKSVGNGTTLPQDLKTYRQAQQVIYLLAEEVAYRMRRYGVRGYTVNLSIKSPQLEWIGAQESISEASSSATTIVNVSEKIFRKLWMNSSSIGLPSGEEGFLVASKQGDALINPVRAIRVAVSNLTTDTRVQLNLFCEGSREDKNDKLSAVFDNVRRKYGTKSISYATLLGSDFEIDFEVHDE
jgi:DNA polymerase-4